MNVPNIVSKHFKCLVLIVCSLIVILALFIITIDGRLKVNQLSQYEEACPSIPPNRLGRIAIDFKEESLEIVETRLSLSLQPGGWFAPKECTANHRVAIVVPKRGREYMLPTFLKNLHPMLMKQQIEYGIYVVEQSFDQDFNRGFLFNIAFKEALKMKDWDCFIFHDIDLIPFDDRNIYNCPPSDGPRHMAVGVDKFGFKLPFEALYGGIIAYTTEQFKKINGFSNMFWNWGGEDNDLCKRSENAGYTLTRPSPDIAVYYSLPHREEKRNTNRFKQLKESEINFKFSGLNSLDYHIKDFKIKPTHVHIFIDHMKVEEPNKKRWT